MLKMYANGKKAVIGLTSYLVSLCDLGSALYNDSFAWWIVTDSEFTRQNATNSREMLKYNKVWAIV